MKSFMRQRKADLNIKNTDVLIAREHSSQLHHFTNINDKSKIKKLNVSFLHLHLVPNPHH